MTPARLAWMQAFPVLLLLFAGCSTPTSVTDRAPGVILISVDTLRADHLPAYGYRDLATPAIDQFAVGSIVFEQAISPAPLTLPSHASLLTGTLPIYHGVRDNSGFVLPPDQVTLPEVLKGQGFDTGAFVGAFVLDSRFGLAQGFDYYYDHFQTDTLDTVALQVSERRAAEVLREARTWIAGRDRDHPFFAFIHLFDPHAPYDAPAPFQAPGRLPYDAEIAYIDDQLSRFWAYLKQEGVFDKSLIVLTSDHGEGLGQHGESTHGMFLYDATLHVPLMVKPPGWKETGKRVRDQVRLIDVPATILDLLRVTAPPQVQGRSLVESWTTGRLPNLAAYSETQLPFLSYGWSPLEAYRLPDRKFIDAPRPELYDPLQDPKEERNFYRDDLPELARLKAARDHLVASASKPGNQTAVRTPDAESTARLRSLGYLGSAVKRPVPKVSSNLTDPKDKIEIFNKIWEAQDKALQGKHEESRRMLAAVIAADPRIFMAHSVQALNLLQLGQPNRAIPHLQAAVSLRPEDPGSHFYLGMASLQTGLLDQAGREFQKAFDMDPENEAALNNLAAVFLRQNRLDQAAVILRKIIERNPNDVAANINLGVTELNRRQYGSAQRAFETAARIDPTLPEAQNNLGLVYLQTDRTDEAILHFERALQLRPLYPNAHFNLAQAYRKKGLHAQADEHLRLAGNAGR